MIDNLLHIITSFFVYSAANPIIFTSISFWVFFTFVFAVFTIIHKQYSLRNIFLFLISIFFYYKTSGLFFLLLLFTITNEFFVAKAIYKSEDKLKRKLLITYSVILNIGFLSYFKYAYFFTDSFNKVFHTNNQVVNYFSQWSNSFAGTHFEIDKILLPIGISFYTFQILTYTLDVYRGKLKPLNNFFDFGFYASFFPQILSGPIVKARDFIPQMNKPYHLNQYQFGLALFMILNGLIKKMVVGDYIATNFIDRIFGNPLLFTGVENLFAVIGYSLQVYLDFSGYTDIAIGIALLMGYRLNRNFNSPYKAENTGDFWKRWHISLSSWLQENLYIPLGGNRKGSIASYIIISVLTIFLALLLDAILVLWIVGGIALVLVILSYYSPKVKHQVDTNINLMITMLLGGLWHNPTVNFLVWGGLNGLGLIIYKFWKKISPYQNLKTLPIHFWKVFSTFMFITFTRIFFRAEDMTQANEVIQKIVYDLKISIAPEIISNFWEVFALMALGFIIHWLPSNIKWQYRKFFIKSPAVIKVVIIVLCVFFIFQTMSSEMKPFIYFQF
ncbi:MAG: MBOAT family protein [bacterium]|nr:MBOAT family protein [bacterium]